MGATVVVVVELVDTTVVGGAAVVVVAGAAVVAIATVVAGARDVDASPPSSPLQAAAINTNPITDTSALFMPA